MPTRINLNHLAQSGATPGQAIVWNGTKWGSATVSGSSNGGTWGTITGAISAQSDLQSSFSLKSDKLSQSINVKDYGVIGDGITDESVNFQAAIDAAFSSGRDVFVPGGHTYRVMNLQLKSDVRIYGPESAILKLPDSASFDSGTHDSLIVTYGTVNRASLVGITLDGNKSVVGGDLNLGCVLLDLKFGSFVNDLLLDGITFQNNGYLAQMAMASMTRYTAQNVKGINTDAVLWFDGGCDGLRINGLTAISGSSEAIMMGSDGGTFFPTVPLFNNISISNVIAKDKVSVVSIFGNVKNAAITNCAGYMSTNNGIAYRIETKLISSNNYSPINISYENCVSDNFGIGAKISGIGVSWLGGSMINNGWYGMRITAAKNVTVSGLVVSGVGRLAEAAAVGVGILVDGTNWIDTGGYVDAQTYGPVESVAIGNCFIESASPKATECISVKSGLGGKCRYVDLRNNTVIGWINQGIALYDVEPSFVVGNHGYRGDTYSLIYNDSPNWCVKMDGNIGGPVDGSDGPAWDIGMYAYGGNVNCMHLETVQMTLGDSTPYINNIGSAAIYLARKIRVTISVDIIFKHLYLGGNIQTPGGVDLNGKAGSVYDIQIIWNGSSYVWNLIPIGAGTWGAITGAISAQNDLQSSLNLKANKSSLPVNVKDYGAVGNGSIDDTISIQNAITASTGIVFFPTGNYKISGITVPANITLRGEGISSSTLITNTSGNAVTISGHNVTIEYIGIAQQSTVRGNGLVSSNCFWLTTTHLSVTGFTNNLYIDRAIYHSHRRLLSDNSTNGVNYWGISGVWNTDWYNNVITFDNCRFTHSTATGCTLKATEVVFTAPDFSGTGPLSGAIGCKIYGENDSEIAHGIKIVSPYCEFTKIPYSFKYAHVEIDSGFVLGGSDLSGSCTSIIDADTSFVRVSKMTDWGYFDYGYRLINNSTLSFGRTFANSIRSNIGTVDGTSKVAEDNIFSDLSIYKNTGLRWKMALSNTELGGNSGSDLDIQAYDDTGTLIDAPMTIGRGANGYVAYWRNEVYFGSPSLSASVNMYCRGAPGYARGFTILSGLDRRWAFAANAQPESSANAGSDLQINAYQDNGDSDNVIYCERIAGGAFQMRRPSVWTGFAGSAQHQTHRIVASNGYQKILEFGTGWYPRWRLTSNATSETGGDVGSDFALESFDDSTYSLIDRPLTVPRKANGIATWVRPLSITSSISANMPATNEVIISSGTIRIARTTDAGPDEVVRGDDSRLGGASSSPNLTGSTTRVVLAQPNGVQRAEDKAVWVSAISAHYDGTVGASWNEQTVTSWGGGSLIQAGDSGVVICIKTDGPNSAIRSTDYGQTWSLASLGPSNNGVAGIAYNAGRFIVSASYAGAGNSYSSIDNGETWSRAFIGGNYNGAIAYGNGTWACHENGGPNIRLSTNGTSWPTTVSITSYVNSAVTDNGGMYYDNGTFILISRDAVTASLCRIHVSADGSTWSKKLEASVNLSGRAAYGNGKWIAITTGAASYVSTDNGQNWSSGATLPATPIDIVYAGGKFIATTTATEMLISSDGVSWSTVSVSDNYGTICKVGEYIVAGGIVGGGDRPMARSSTGFINAAKNMLDIGSNTDIRVADLSGSDMRVMYVKSDGTLLASQPQFFSYNILSIQTSGNSISASPIYNSFVFTGTSGQSFILPPTSLNASIIIKNRSMGTITVSGAGSDTIDGKGAQQLIGGTNASMLIVGTSTEWVIL